MSDPQPPSGDEPSLGGSHGGAQPKTDDVQLGGDSALLHIITSLNHSDPNVRKRAAFTLAARGDARAYDALMHVYHEGERSLRAAIVRALGKLGDVRAYDLLVENLVNEGERWGVRRAAAEGLGLLGDSRAIDVLSAQLTAVEEIMYNARQPATLYDAIIGALLQLHDRRALPALLQALGRFSWGGTTSPLIPEILEFVRSVSDDQTIADLVRWADEGATGAIIAVEYLNDPRVLPHLIAILHRTIEEKSNFFGTWMERSLAAHGSPEQVNALTALLQQINVAENGAAARGIIDVLGRIGDPRAFDVLLPLLDTALYWHVADALGSLRDWRATQPIIALLRRERKAHNDSREEAYLYGVGLLGDPSALEDIAVSIHSPRDPIRHRAIEAIGRINSPEAITILLDTYHHHDKFGMRYEALKALEGYYHADMRVPPVMMAALRSSHRSISVQATFALVRLGDTSPDLVQALAGMLEMSGYNPNYPRVLEALRRIGTPEALAIVHQAEAEAESGRLEDEDE